MKIFDMDHFLADWRDNCITDKSLICKDMNFFDELTEGAGDTYGTTNVRHGLYAFSSKDWNDIKGQIAEENKQAKAEHIQVLKETGQYKSEEQLELEKLEREAQALKNKILPSKVKVGAESDFGFGFCEDSQGEEEFQEEQGSPERDAEDYGDEEDQFDENLPQEEEEEAEETLKEVIQKKMKNKFVQQDFLKLKELCQKEERAEEPKSACLSPMSQNPFKKEKEEKDPELEKKFEKFKSSPEKKENEKAEKVDKENKKPESIILQDSSTTVTPVKLSVKKQEI